MFLDYLHEAKPAGAVAPVMSGFRQSLLGSMSDDEADETVGCVLRRLGSDVDAMAVLFDNVFAADSYYFNTEPNALVAEAARGMAPGRALDVATGQGRNAIFLAGLGWDVTGLDVSEVGLDRLRVAANVRGVDITTVLADVGSYDLGEAVWDLVILCYAPVGLTRGDLMDRVLASLRPGGRLVIESFSAPEEDEAVRPVDLVPDLVAAALEGMDLVVFEAVTAVPDWDTVERGVIRVIASKPG